MPRKCLLITTHLVHVLGYKNAIWIIQTSVKKSVNRRPAFASMKIDAAIAVAVTFSVSLHQAHRTTLNMPGKTTTVGNSTKRTTDMKIPVKLDGTKDKRYATAQFVKSDGTRDMRTSFTSARR
jgi:hypothetical protein